MNNITDEQIAEIEKSWPVPATENEVRALISRLRAAERDAARYRFIADSAADVIMCASSTDYGDGDKTWGPRVEIDPGQYPIDMFGSAKEKLDAAIDAAMARLEPNHPA